MSILFSVLASSISRSSFLKTIIVSFSFIMLFAEVKIFDTKPASSITAGEIFLYVNVPGTITFLSIFIKVSIVTEMISKMSIAMAINIDFAIVTLIISSGY